MFKRFVCAACLALAALAAGAHAAPPAATGLAGHWVGQWVRDGSALEVEVDFARTDSGYAGRFGSEALRVLDIPFRAVTLAADSVHWLLVGDETTSRFAGTLAGDTLRGVYHEGEAPGTFLLHRAAQHASPYATEQVHFSNGPVTLAGSLLVPPGAGPHPAIVFLHGSGAESRHASQFLADRFARAGFVALIYDKRGVGGSSGDWQQASFQDLAADALAGIRMLAADHRVRADAIGIHGHSQGGTIAPLVASQYGKLAFVIGSSAGGTSLLEGERYSYANYLGVPRMHGADSLRAAGYIDVLVRTAYAGAPRAALDSAVAANTGAKWFETPPPPTSSWWAMSRANVAYDPAAYWRQVRAPVLLVYGEKDERVPVLPSMRNIEAALRAGGNTSISMRIYPGADHTLRINTPTDTRFHWPRNPPGYPQLLTVWAEGRVRTARH